MLAIQFDQPGAADALQLNDVPAPSPGPGQALVEFEASVINPADMKILGGAITPRNGSAPFTLGYDIVGRVVASGPGASRLTIGSRVIGLSIMAAAGEGTWAEFVCLPEDSLVEVSEGLGPEVWAQLPLAGSTAYQAVDALGESGRSTVLVVGAAGAVGRIAVQLLRDRGHRVVAVVRTEQQAALVRDTVDTVFVEQMQAESVDGVVDTAGVDFSHALRAGGRYVSVVPGSLPHASSPSMAGKDAEFILTRQSGDVLDKLAQMVERGELTLPEPRLFVLRDVRRAHDAFAKKEGERIVLLR
ncbi:MAG: hypothetical protein ABS81_01025 [Pseudonocardia sp. SCN 72-86]|nr:MAG: hypothetical protein ABS81_01025 [Pseudonocardia sp. SCN 72-86]